MAKVSVSVTGITTQNKDNSRTLGYVNPEATNAQLKQMAIAYNALSTKTYQGGEKIVRTDINDPDTSKPIPTLTTTETQGSDMWYIDITYDGDGEIAYQIDDDRNSPDAAIKIAMTQKRNVNNTQPSQIAIIKGTVGNVHAKLYIYSTETENYAANKVTIEKTPWFS